MQIVWWTPGKSADILSSTQISVGNAIRSRTASLFWYSEPKASFIIENWLQHTILMSLDIILILTMKMLNSNMAQDDKKGGISLQITA